MLLESCEPITMWVITMQGPESSPEGFPRIYEGKLFRCGLVTDI